MLNMVDNIISNVIEGEMPKVHFVFPPNLTEEATTTIIDMIYVFASL